MTNEEKVKRVCSICGHPRIELPWSKTGEERMYILTCDNSGCRCFRTPVATIKRLEVTGKSGQGRR